MGYVHNGNGLPYLRQFRVGQVWEEVVDNSDIMPPCVGFFWLDTGLASPHFALLGLATEILFCNTRGIHFTWIQSHQAWPLIALPTQF